jgi:4-hydroxybenzoate polyprenyltransferase
VPLVLDLDRTLLRTDVLHELALAYVKANPLHLFLLIAWLFRGKSFLKRQLSQLVVLNVDTLPVNETVAEYARDQKFLGRQVVLATATDALVARRIAKRFDFIDLVVSTENGVNLKGEAKARRLAEMFPQGFDYAGDSHADLAVWRIARSAIVVGQSVRLARKAERLTRLESHIRGGALLKPIARAFRPHQWAKNGLVFAPLILAGMSQDPGAWLQAGAAFLALSLLASATYLLNDLFDLHDDRLHWTKRNRPIASGALSIPHAMALVTGLLAVVAGLALLISPLGVAVLAAYGALTIAYSLWLKRQPIVDAFVLACLFTLRLGLGIAAVGAEPSSWLLVFSMFLFTSLSFAKRYTEIARMQDRGRSEVSGRGYVVADAGLVLAMGVASGLGAIVIMVLYLIEDAFGAGFYLAPVFLWSFPAILFLWIGRVWLLCHRGELNDDPVAFAVRDRTSLALAGVMAVTFLLATGLYP